MAHKGTRNQIVEAADQLIYNLGYEPTSFARIADAVQISRGNFYYHFKSKDDILDAVIRQRLEDTRKMLADWEEHDDPLDRIKCYVRIVLTNWAKIRRFGCPVGTLCTELAKLDHSAHPSAAAVFTLFRDWLVEQFEALGLARDADELAMRVLAWSQGVATIGNTYQDERFVRREVRRVCGWLDSLVADEAEHAAVERAGKGR